MDIITRFVPLLGIAAMVGICLLVSSNRKAALARWDLFLWAFGLQAVFAIFVLKTETGQILMKIFNDGFIVLNDQITKAGSAFVFGDLATGEMGFFFAFSVLPTIIVFSALMAILYHVGALQIIVYGISWIMQKTMKTSGAETLSAAGNIFVGQTEAPLLVRPYLNRMTRSELMTVMTGGFATVAGGVLAAYVGLLSGSIPNIAGHLLAASIMSAPAALLFGKIMVPETEIAETANKLHVEVEKPASNVIEAATVGTTEGIRLFINVAGMLLAFLALIALVDVALISLAEAYIDEVPEWLSLRGIVGYLFAPLAFLMGITDWGEAVQVGQLLGVKMVANEFVAYLDLAMMTANGAELSERSRLIATYALCGFANFGSIGIQIGGLSVIAPDRRKELSELALRAMFAGTFAANSTACVAAILL